MSSNPDRVAAIYKGKSIFISGATGFLGKVLLEKLLRCATGINKIYLLIRKKKGVPVMERMNLIFQNPLFNILRNRNPEVLEKCIGIPGDVSYEDLGISDFYRNILIEEVDFIFHCAATTRFDISFLNSVITNTRGTKYMLDLAKQCKHLKLFVHVSTGFAHYKEKIVEEKIYDPPVDPDDVLDSLKFMNESDMDAVAKSLLGDVPNSYTYSKLLAEALVAKELGKIPFVIARPVVVIPVLYDPYPGWTDSLQGPMGLFVAAGKGVLRIVYMDENTHAKVMPVDVTISGILVASWNYLENKGVNVVNLAAPKEDFDMRWKEVIDMGNNIVKEKVPFNVFLWYPGGKMTKNKIEYYIKFVLYQLIPAFFVDILLVIMGYPRVLVKSQFRINTAMSMFEHYTFSDWEFSTVNGENVRKLLNPTEKKIYILDSTDLDIEKYLLDCIRTVKRIILKESELYDTTMLKVMKGMYYVDKICKALLVYFLFLFIKNIFYKYIF